MAPTIRLEDIFFIRDRSYTTGSEWLDGLIIGLVTMLLIRNVELVIFDILTFTFGNRKHRIGFRVLRIWQMLNMNHIYNLLTGFDSDIPYSYLRAGRSRNVTGSRIPIFPCWRTRKDKFAGLLFISVLLGKLSVLGAEVAIIAFVIPIAKVHNSEGGLGIKWKNATVTEGSLFEMTTCQRLVASEKLTDSAQLAVCKRVEIQDQNQVTPLPQKWISNGSLRMEEEVLTLERVRNGGGFVDGLGNVFCKGLQDRTPSRASGKPPHETRNALSPFPHAIVSNNIRWGLIGISGYTIRTQNGSYYFGSAAIQPIFSDVHRMLPLAFSESFFNDSVTVGSKALTLNGKLLLSTKNKTNQMGLSRNICPEALGEIQRVGGTLHPELIVDILRSSMAAVAVDSFSEPSTELNALNTVSGFEIGVSKKFRIQPEWMGLASVISILISAVTSRLNRTEVRMARIYREHNNMWSACSPAFLGEENVADSALFKRDNEYHWGESPGKGWDENSTIDFSEDVILR